MPKVSNNYFDISSIYSPRIREREIQPYKDRVEKVEAKVKGIDNKTEALNKLSTLVADLNSAAMSFCSNNLKGAFSLRTVSIDTDDLGKGSDYIDVTVDNNLAKGRYNVHVQQIATASSVTLASDSQGNGFLSREPISTYMPRLAGNDQFDLMLPLEIFIKSDDLILPRVQLNNSDNLYAIKDKINSQLSNFNIRADVVANNGREFLTVSSTITGVNELEVKFNSIGILGEDNIINIPEIHRDEGVNSVCIIGGVEFIRPSNTIKDAINGMTFELKKPNTTNQNNLTIGIKHNVEAVTHNIMNLIETYNKFIDFAESQNKTTLVKGIPTSSDDAYLFSSHALTQAASNAKTLLNLLPARPGEMSSLADIGVGIPSTFGIAKQIPGVPKKTKIEILDAVKLRNAIIYKTDDVKNLLNRVCDRFASQIENVDTRIKSELSASSKEATNLKDQEKAAATALTKAQKKIDDRVLKFELMAFMFQQEMDNLDLMLDSLNG